MEHVVPENFKKDGDENEGNEHIVFKNNFGGAMKVFPSKIVTTHIPIEVCDIMAGSWHVYAAEDLSKRYKCGKLLKDAQREEKNNDFVTVQFDFEKMEFNVEEDIPVIYTW